MEINEHRQILGERIKLLREEHDMTLAELSSACGISLRRLQRLERAVCKCRLEELCRLAVVFWVPIDFLVGITDERTPRPRAKKRTP